jgi:hypothetical protein
MKSFGLLPCELLSQVYATNTLEELDIVKREVGMDPLTTEAALTQELQKLEDMHIYTSTTSG